MLYLAYLMCKSHSSNPTGNQTATFLSGFMMQFLNPKVVLFSWTVIPTFVMPHYSTASAVTVSIVALTLIGFLAFTTWVLFGRVFKSFFQKHNRIASVMMALLLVYAALMIWL